MAWYSPILPWRRKAADEVPLDQLTREFLLGQSGADVPVVTPDNALRSPTVFAIVHGLSRVLAMLPVHVIDTTDGERRPVDDHPLGYLLNVEPNPWQTRQEYWSQMGQNLLLRGEALARKAQAANGRVVYLVPLQAGEASCRQREDFSLEYRVNRPGMAGTYGQAQMHHIRAMTADGVSGVSPVEQVREAIALEIAAQRMALNLFGNAAVPNVVLTHPAHFRDDDALTRFKTSWREAFGGGRRGTAVLEDGLKAEQLQLSNEESQFLETRKLQRGIIAAAWGVPPHRVGDLERATFCLPAGTEVLTVTGPKPIEQIEAGEQVWSRGEGWTRARVLAAGCSGEDPILTIRTKHRTLRANAQHPVLVRRKRPSPHTGVGGYQYVAWEDVFVPAGELCAGDALLCVDRLDCGSEELMEFVSRVVEITVGDTEPVYDLTVEETHTFVADGVVVHNSNIEQQALELVIYCLTPYLAAIEGALERDLLAKSERGRLQVRFNVKALLRGDLQSRSAALKIQREAGVLSPNEWRRIEDMPPRDDPGGDEYQKPMNTPAKGAPDNEQPAAQPPD